MRLKTKFNRKKFIITMLIIFVVSVSIAGILASREYKEYSLNIDYVDAEVFENKSLGDMDSIKDINIYSSCFDVEVKSVNGDEGSLKVIGDIDDKDSEYKPIVKIAKTKSKIDIEVKAKTHNVPYRISNRVKIQILVPKKYDEDMALKLAAGDIDIDGTDVENMNIDLAAGGIDIRECKLNTLNIRQAAGDIELRDISGEIDVKNTAGDISMDLNNLEGDIEILASAGDVDIKLPSDEEFKVDVVVLAGEAETNFGIVGEVSNRRINGYNKNDSAKNCIKIKSLCGDVEIKH